MKYVLAVLALTLGPGLTMADETVVSLKPLTALELAEGETAFPVEDSEATVNGDLIKRFSLGEKAVTASYQNKSELKKRPRYTVELYNAYGLLLGEDTTGTSTFSFGGPGFIDPGAVGSEELRVTWYPMDRILSKSGVPLPDDWQTVKWVVLKDNNPRELKADKN
jgi:hypothetical protein